jgi:hypothetical protein
MQDQGPYLSEQMEKPVYRQALTNVVSSADAPVPRWIGDIARHGGTEAGSDLVTVNGESFELYYVCQPHHCDEHVLTVMFTRGGGKAWLFILNGEHELRSTLGNPSAAQIQVVINHRDN